MPADPAKAVTLNRSLGQTTALRGELAAGVNRVPASGLHVPGGECAALPAGEREGGEISAVDGPSQALAREVPVG